MTQVRTPQTSRENQGQTEPLVRRLLGRISRFELAVGAVIAVLMLLLVIIEPNVLEAPFENARTLLFTFGGTLLAAGAFAAMLWFRVPPAVRVVVLLVPFAIVNWWLISPYFIDDVVDEEFATSIFAQLPAETDAATSAPAAAALPTTAPVQEPVAASAEAQDATASDTAATDPEPAAEEPTAVPAAPTGPTLLGAGQFVGLAGHDGTGDAGIFQSPDGTYVLRFENFDIENGPDLEVYLVPGADQTSLPAGSISLGELKGNIGDQTYELPAGTELPPGPYTALVWCEAFSVEFVGATVNI